MEIFTFFLKAIRHLQSFVSLSGLDLSEYGSYLFLGLLLLVLLPAVILGILQIRSRVYGALASVGMSMILIWATKLGMRYFVFFVVFQMTLILLYDAIRRRTAGRLLYYLFLLLSLAPLLVYKFSSLTGSNLLGFLGISYLTFKTAAMIIEIYDGSISNVKWFRLFYFLVFFPTLSSGPIDRYRRFEEDTERKISRHDYLSDYLPNGIRKIIMGIGYKFVLAYLIHTFWLVTIPSAHTFLNTMNYMYAYSFYLFFDFAGYSNFAIGASYILGVKTPANFNMPFLSLNMKDFWTRWHISLSKWFGDYLYSRLTLNFLRKKIFADKHAASYTAQIITMLTMGFWHGFTVYYILYGLYQGVLLVLTDIYERKVPFHKKHKNRFGYQIAQVIITFHLVCFGFLLFSGYFFN